MNLTGVHPSAIAYELLAPCNKLRIWSGKNCANRHLAALFCHAYGACRADAAGPAAPLAAAQLACRCGW